MIYSVDYELKQIALLDASSNANLDPNNMVTSHISF